MIDGSSRNWAARGGGSCKRVSHCAYYTSTVIRGFLHSTWCNGMGFGIDGWLCHCGPLCKVDHHISKMRRAVLTGGPMSRSRAAKVKQGINTAWHFSFDSGLLFLGLTFFSPFDNTFVANKSSSKTLPVFFKNVSVVLFTSVMIRQSHVVVSALMVYGRFESLPFSPWFFCPFSRLEVYAENARVLFARHRPPPLRWNLSINPAKTMLTQRQKGQS